MNLVKYYKNDELNGKTIEMRPDQEAILHIHCENKHYLTSVKLTPFCTVDIRAKCSVCGEFAQGTNLGLVLHKK